MTVALPARYTVRPPGQPDAEAIYELLSTRNLAIAGVRGCTLADVQSDLAEPGFDHETDSWLVFEGDRLIGSGATFGKGDRRSLDIGAFSDDPVVADWLLVRALQRARELGRAHGQREISVDTVTYRGDEPQRERLIRAGFVASTTYQQLRVDHSAPVVAPAPPAGVVLHRGTFDGTARRAAHAVQNACFAGQFGYTPRPYDEWCVARESRSTFDWSQLTLLELDGRPVAIRECTSEFVEDENCGYIGRVGVLEGARGRGLATYLLRDAFAVDAAAGRSGTMLHVDTNNPTPALDLYLSVGMRPNLVTDAWRLTTGTE